MVIKPFSDLKATRKLRVVRRPVVAPLRSIIRLVTRVVPWIALPTFPGRQCHHAPDLPHNLDDGPGRANAGSQPLSRYYPAGTWIEDDEIGKGAAYMDALLVFARHCASLCSASIEDPRVIGVKCSQDELLGNNIHLHYSRNKVHLDSQENV